jgi:DNA-binding HxlR family transcriptional regulator
MMNVMPAATGLRDMDTGVCSIARTMTVIGQPWTVLVLRDLFNGLRRFDELAEHLGVARNVLARRLASLVEHGLVERVEYREPGQRTRHEYRLTPEGWDLRPVLLALMDYGDRHFAGEDGPPLRLLHRDCGAAVSVRLECTEGHRLESADRLVPDPSPGARTTGRHREN